MLTSIVFRFPRLSSIPVTSHRPQPHQNVKQQHQSNQWRRIPFASSLSIVKISFCVLLVASMRQINMMVKKEDIAIVIVDQSPTTTIEQQQQQQSDNVIIDRPTTAATETQQQQQQQTGSVLHQQTSYSDQRYEQVDAVIRMKEEEHVYFEAPGMDLAPWDPIAAVGGSQRVEGVCEMEIRANCNASLPLRTCLEALPAENGTSEDAQGESDEQN